MAGWGDRQAAEDAAETKADVLTKLEPAEVQSASSETGAKQGTRRAPGAVGQFRLLIARAWKQAAPFCVVLSFCSAGTLSRLPPKPLQLSHIHLKGT